MKRCPICGNNLRDDARFCGACGTNFANTPPPVTPPPYGGYTTATGSSFVTPDERIVYTLKNDVAINFLTGAGFSKLEGTVTNKHVYYNHRRGLLNIRKKEEIIRIKDITGVKIVNVNPLGLLVTAALVFLLGIVFAPKLGASMFFVGLIGALIFGVSYLFGRISLLRVEAAGGPIRILMKGYSIEKIREFQMNILQQRLMMDN